MIEPHACEQRNRRLVAARAPAQATPASYQVLSNNSAVSEPVQEGPGNRIHPTPLPVSPPQTAGVPDASVVAGPVQGLWRPTLPRLGLIVRSYLPGPGVRSQFVEQ